MEPVKAEINDHVLASFTTCIRLVFELVFVFRALISVELDFCWT